MSLLGTKGDEEVSNHQQHKIPTPRALNTRQQSVYNLAACKRGHISAQQHKIHTPRALQARQQERLQSSIANERFEPSFLFSVDEPVQFYGGLRAKVPQVLSLEVEAYEQHVYSYQPLGYYIKGKLRGCYMTLKRYRWEVKKEIKEEQFHHEVSVLR